MISALNKTPLRSRGVAAYERNTPISTTREKLAIAAGGSCDTNTPRKTPPSLAALVPPSCSQNAPVLPLQQHLTGLGASGGNAPLHAGENFKTRGLS